MKIGAIWLAMLLVASAGIPAAMAADNQSDSGVLAASAQFYAALNKMLNGDAGPLAAVWSHSADVSTMHPIGGREIGWDQVKASWENVAKIASDGTVELKDQVVRVVGDLAYETGTEQGSFKLAGHDISGFQGRVTNIYQRTDGGWKVVHHHVDLSQAMVDVLRQLPPPEESGN
jgi:ketosteroid isomerase-like protein